MPGKQKRYYIRLPEYFYESFSYLNIGNKETFFEESLETKMYKTKFTDKQISEMPIEIQKAIECGFLRKVLVK
jgi:hypothetical protein